MADLRNPLAKARDEFLESPEGIRTCEGITSGQYLRNRIESAFIAGWNARIEREFMKRTEPSEGEKK